MPAPSEIIALACAGLIHVPLFAVFSIRANRELGSRYCLSPRDAPPQRPMSPLTGRLQRAMNNQFEALILFTVAVVAVTLGEASSPLTRAAAWLFVAARLLYIPAYALGLSPWRSAIWATGFGATVTLLISALL